jgi:hypothetical protein
MLLKTTKYFPYSEYYFWYKIFFQNKYSLKYFSLNEAQHKFHLYQTFCYWNGSVIHFGWKIEYFLKNTIKIYGRKWIKAGILND